MKKKKSLQSICAVEQSPQKEKILELYLAMRNGLTKSALYRQYIQPLDSNISYASFYHWTKDIDRIIQEEFDAYVQDSTTLDAQKQIKEQMIINSVADLLHDKINKLMGNPEQKEKLTVKEVLNLYKISKDIEGQNKTLVLQGHGEKRKDATLLLFYNLLHDGRINANAIQQLEDGVRTELESLPDDERVSIEAETRDTEGFENVSRGGKES